MALAQSYPALWWTPVPEDNKPDWEILPQAAKPGEVILSKRNELGILSNFAPTPFTYRGKRYASVEGFWQMMLYPERPDDPRAKAPGIAWPHTREQVAQMTALDAKNAGDFAFENMKKLGIDWVTFEGRRITYWSKTKGEHYRIVVEVMRAKLDQNPKVREILLSTGDLVLRPDHFQEEDLPPSGFTSRSGCSSETNFELESGRIKFFDSFHSLSFIDRCPVRLHTDFNPPN